MNETTRQPQLPKGSLDILLGPFVLFLKLEMAVSQALVGLEGSGLEHLVDNFSLYIFHGTPWTHVAHGPHELRPKSKNSDRNS